MLLFTCCIMLIASSINLISVYDSMNVIQRMVGKTFDAYGGPAVQRMCMGSVVGDVNE